MLIPLSDRASELGAEIAIIGGSGFYSLDGLEQKQQVEVDTEFGAPTDTLTTGVIAGVDVVVLAR